MGRRRTDRDSLRGGIALIVFSHLRWRFVLQRPQHFVSRLAGRWREAFVKEPIQCDGPAWLDERDVAPDNQQCWPNHLPSARTAPK